MWQRDIEILMRFSEPGKDKNGRDFDGKSDIYEWIKINMKKKF